MLLFYDPVVAGPAPWSHSTMVVTKPCKTSAQSLQGLKHAACSDFQAPENNSRNGPGRRFSTIVTGFVNSLYQNPLYMNGL
jgi:hypothetical protein